jgi:hypothetical protein
MAGVVGRQLAALSELLDEREDHAYNMTELTRSCVRTPLCLRQQGTSHLCCVSFFCAARAKNKQQKKEKDHNEKTKKTTA